MLLNAFCLLNLSDYELLMKLLQLPSETRQEWMENVQDSPSPTPSTSSSMVDDREAILEDLLAKYRAHQAQSTNPGDTTSNPITINEDDNKVNPLEVLKLLTSIKDQGFGELIHDKDNTKIWYMTVGQNLRYTINKELQIDCNVYNDDIYMHVKRKFPKQGRRSSDAVSIRAGLLPAFDAVLGHATENIQSQLQGKNVDSKFLALAQKLCNLK